MLAAEGGHLDVVTYLKEAGADYHGSDDVCALCDLSQRRSAACE